MSDDNRNTQPIALPNLLAQKVNATSLAWRDYRLTATLVIFTLLVHFSPWLSDQLQLDFAAVAHGQWWRIWTGHLTHYTDQHLFWDLLVFAVLCAACERQWPRLIFPALLLTAAGISASLAWWCNDLSIYRGLSGIDTALFVWFIGAQLCQAVLEKDGFASAGWSVLTLLLCGKLIFEAQTGQMMFVDAHSFTPLVEAHLVGVCIGATYSGMTRLTR